MHLSLSLYRAISENVRDERDNTAFKVHSRPKDCDRIIQVICTGFVHVFIFKTSGEGSLFFCFCFFLWARRNLMLAMLKPNKMARRHIIDSCKNITTALLTTDMLLYLQIPFYNNTHTPIYRQQLLCFIWREIFDCESKKNFKLEICCCQKLQVKNRTVSRSIVTCM